MTVNYLSIDQKKDHDVMLTVIQDTHNIHDDIIVRFRFDQYILLLLKPKADGTGR